MTRNEKEAHKVLKGLEKEQRKLVQHVAEQRGKAQALHGVIASLIMQYARENHPNAVGYIKQRNEQHERGELSHTEHIALISSVLHQQSMMDYDEELKHTAPAFYEELQIRKALWGD